MLLDDARKMPWHSFFKKIGMSGHRHKYTARAAADHLAWWKEAVIYQVYPRSFKDTDGDGVGDLKGIISKLDHISSLGTDIVWINPVYASPDRDNGYDISDFRAIQPKMGTMDDLVLLIRKVHEKGMKIIMDMVINHTSDEHSWFREARRSRKNPFYSFYHWWPEEKGEPPHRCGFFDPAGKGWHYNKATRSWYLHYFSEHQPDLNWENPAVREQLYAMLRYWLDQGIDGFRLDAITFISKDTRWPFVTPTILNDRYYGDWGHYYANGPRLHEYLQEMHEKVWRYYNAVTIAEAPGITSDEAHLFVDPARKELDMLCHFEGIMAGYMPGQFKKMRPGGYDLKELKKIYTDWDGALSGKGWGTIYLGNHDQPRMISHWGCDKAEYRELSAKMLFTFLLTMRATPFIYNGDEIGMVNIKFDRIEDYRDIETKKNYQRIKDSGGDVGVFIKDQQLAGRDNGRTPYQWDSRPNGGFTNGKPWLKVNPNYAQVNAAAQEKDPSSLLNFVRYLVRLRRNIPSLIYGKYELLLPEHPAIYAYCRRTADDCWMVLLNFSSFEVCCPPDAPIPIGAGIIVNNYPGIRHDDGRWWLQPYQALVCRVEDKRA
jgi:oligo-1,6-glucosidase